MVRQARGAGRPWLACAAPEGPLTSTSLAVEGGMEGGRGKDGVVAGTASLRAANCAGIFLLVAQVGKI